MALIREVCEKEDFEGRDLTFWCMVSALLIGFGWDFVASVASTHPIEKKRFVLNRRFVEPLAVRLPSEAEKHTWPHRE